LSTFRSPVRRAGAVVLFASALALAGCGATASGTPGASAQAPTPQPATATPALSAAPSDAPTDVPSAAASGALPSIGASLDPADNGGFAFKPGDVLAYYASQGFTCEGAQPSTLAKGYSDVRCLKKEDSGATALFVLDVNDETGIIGDAFAGYINAAGGKAPDPASAAAHLGGFISKMLGPDAAAEAATWVTTNLTANDLKTTFGPITALIYQENDEGGVGHYVEVASDTYLKAPAP
jgi:hypothetical protein